MVEKKKILVAGSLNVDQTIDVVDFPVKGETISGSGLRYSNGGKGANQAVAAGKMLGDVSMLGCVGADDFGTKQIQNLEASGVRADALKVTSDEATGMAIIYVNKEGDNCIVLAPGANYCCDAEYLKANEDRIREADIVLTQMEIPMESVLYLLHTAAEAKKIVCLNPAPAPEVMPAEVYGLLDYITPNETELSKLAGMPCETLPEIKAASEELFRRGVKNVLVTIGEKGVVLTNASGTRLFPTNPQKPVDTTAAGDTFNAAFLVGLSEGMDEEEAIRLGNIASSITVTRRGAQDAVPSRNEVNELLKDFHPEVTVL